MVQVMKYCIYRNLFGSGAGIRYYINRKKFKNNFMFKKAHAFFFETAKWIL